jgi:hypothetical protein
MTYCYRAQSFDESCQGILARTKGALFFGVPTPIGSSTSWFGEYLHKILGSEYGVDQSISIDLSTKFSGEFGELFRADWKIFQNLSRSRGWLLFLFYESKPALTRSGHTFVSFAASSLSARKRSSYSRDLQITAVEDNHPAENFDILPGDHYTMCRFQTSDDDGFIIVCRRFRSLYSGGQILSLRFDPIEVPKAKEKLSGILESSQAYNSQYIAPAVQDLLLIQPREFRSIY